MRLILFIEYSFFYFYNLFILPKSKNFKSSTITTENKLFYNFFLILEKYFPNEKLINLQTVIFICIYIYLFTHIFKWTVQHTYKYVS